MSREIGYASEHSDIPGFKSENSTRLFQAGRSILWTIILVMSVVQYSSAWYFPNNAFGGLETLITERQGSVPFQYVLWAMVLFGTIIHVAEAGFDHLAKVLMPWLPLFVVGVIASALGINPVQSLKGSIHWLLMALAAACVGKEVRAFRSRRILLWSLLFLLLTSIIFALALPAVGTHVYSADKLWRGVFSTKNQLGWISSLAALIFLGFCERKMWKLSALGMLLAIICLLASGSKGALAALLCTLFYGYLFIWLTGRLSPGLGIAVAVTALVCMTLFGLLILPEILSLLGRDPTLTGRTTIWNMYLQSMLNTPWLGQGPASFTMLSSLTAPLAQRLGELGAIVTPHNAFLGAFGDGGILGLIAFSGVLIYFALIQPFFRMDRLTRLCGLIAFFIMAHGIVETHEIFGAGAGWYFLILVRGISMQQGAESAMDLAGVSVPRHRQETFE